MAECIVNHKPENLHILPVTNQVHGCQIGITHLILIFLKHIDADSKIKPFKSVLQTILHVVK